MLFVWRRCKGGVDAYKAHSCGLCMFEGILILAMVYRELTRVAENTLFYVLRFVFVINISSVIPFFLANNAADYDSACLYFASNCPFIMQKLVLCAAFTSLAAARPNLFMLIFKKTGKDCARGAERCARVFAFYIINFYASRIAQQNNRAVRGKNSYNNKDSHSSSG